MRQQSAPVPHGLSDVCQRQHNHICVLTVYGGGDYGWPFWMSAGDPAAVYSAVWSALASEWRRTVYIPWGSHALPGEHVLRIRYHGNQKTTSGTDCCLPAMRSERRFPMTVRTCRSKASSATMATIRIFRSSIPLVFSNPEPWANRQARAQHACLQPNAGRQYGDDGGFLRIKRFIRRRRPYVRPVGRPGKWAVLLRNPNAAWPNGNYANVGFYTAIATTMQAQDIHNLTGSALNISTIRTATRIYTQISVARCLHVRGAN